MNDIATCGECMYYERDGTCRLNPPAILGIQYPHHYSDFPQVRKAWWCSHFVDKAYFTDDEDELVKTIDNLWKEPL